MSSMKVNPVTSFSAEETGGSRYKLLGSGGSETGPGPDCAPYVSVFLGSNICRFKI